MNIDQLKLEWANDCEIDQTKLDEAALNVPRLHAKYIGQLMQFKMKLVSLKIEKDELVKVRYRYYRGEMGAEELVKYKWEQYQNVKPTSAGMERLIDGDEHINKLTAKIEYINNMIYFYESIMNQITSMGFSIKNSIEFKRLLAGG